MSGRIEWEPKDDGTVGAFERMTPQQQRDDIIWFWVRFAALGYNINKIDQIDPINRREPDEVTE